MEQYYRWYGTYPERLCADAGYGSLANYEYCDQKGIKAFIKYGSWNREKTVRNPATYEYVDENTFQCLGESKEQRSRAHRPTIDISPILPTSTLRIAVDAISASTVDVI